MSRLKKGDVVWVRAVVETSCGAARHEHEPGVSLVHIPDKKKWPTPGLRKRMYRVSLEPPERGLVTGESYRATGWYLGSHFNDGDWEAAHLQEDMRHPVIIVQPLDNPRYLKPWACLSQDLELAVEGPLQTF